LNFEGGDWRHFRRVCGELAVRSFTAFSESLGGDEPATQIVLLFLLPFASYLIAEHIGFSGILAAVAAGMTITRSGVMRTAPLAMRLRANSTWAMLEFVFNGMVFLLLGLQLPGILESSLAAAAADPNVETWMLFTDIVLIYCALMLVRFGWLWTMKRFSVRFLHKKPMEFGSWSTRELLIATFAGAVRLRWPVCCLFRCFYLMASVSRHVMSWCSLPPG
jgi:CPA1 family monovalent cation:H+ antiporter